SADRSDNSGDLGIGYRNGTVDDNLTGFWRMDASSDPVAGSFDVRDYSGNNNNGTTKNFDGDERGKQGIFSTNSFDFDGSDDNVTVPYNPSLEIDNSNFTVSLWAYRFTSNTGGMVSKRAGGDEWQVWVGSLGGGDDQLKFYNGASTVSTGHIVEEKEWVHLSVVYNGSQALFYVNGSFISSQTISAPSDNNAGIHLQTDGSTFASGRIDEVRIYNRTLSTSEIKKLYFHGRNGTFKGNWNRTQTNSDLEIPDNEIAEEITIDSENINNSANQTIWANITNTKGETALLKLPDGSRTKDYRTNFTERGGNITIQFNFTSTNATQTPTIDSYDIWTEKADKFTCDKGTLDTTCTINTYRPVQTNTSINGTGNLYIKNGGNIINTTNNQSYKINMTGNITIKNGGTITGNV
ncbi:MAG: LamG domain-containing protein, partial [Candidatus Nanohaloarchaea archaeon]|nr:LamG domain-containing protein [Candidatus Nanohaloarchaea archaeon]